MTPAEAARRQAERTRLEQGLPAHVEDPAALARLADLIGDSDHPRYVPVTSTQRRAS